jgi:hypothetical protein
VWIRPPEPTHLPSRGQGYWRRGVCVPGCCSPSPRSPPSGQASLKPHLTTAGAAGHRACCPWTPPSRTCGASRTRSSPIGECPPPPPAPTPSRSTPCRLELTWSRPYGLVRDPTTACVPLAENTAQCSSVCVASWTCCDKCTRRRTFCSRWWLRRTRCDTAMNKLRIVMFGISGGR